jgi:hypothetical protein
MIKYRYFLSLPTAVLMVRYWPFNRQFVSEDIVMRMHDRPATWLEQALR